MNTHRAASVLVALALMVGAGWGAVSNLNLEPWVQPSDIALRIVQTRAIQLQNQQAEYAFRSKLEYNQYVNDHFHDLIGKYGAEKQNAAMIRAAQLKSNYDGSSFAESYRYYLEIRELTAELISADTIKTQAQEMESPQQPQQTKPRKSRFPGGPVEK